MELDQLPHQERLELEYDLLPKSPVSHGPVLLQIGWYALAVVVVAVAAVILLGIGAARMDIISVRRTQGRTGYRPLWQRLNLDLIAAALALSGLRYFALFLQHSSLPGHHGPDTGCCTTQPDPPIFLIISCLLLSLRGLNWLLRMGALLASKGQGSVSMLTLAQMERAPQQPARMILLLALCVAFSFSPLSLHLHRPSALTI